MNKKTRRKLARILREAVDTVAGTIDSREACRRVAYWWPTLEISPDETTVDIAIALTGVSLPTARRETYERGKLLHAVRCARRPHIRFYGSDGSLRCYVGGLQRRNVV